jgi:hypothetical protein
MVQKNRIRPVRDFDAGIERAAQFVEQYDGGLFGLSLKDLAAEIRALAPAVDVPKLEEQWERFCVIYPVRVGANPKAEGKHSFERMAKRGVDPETMIQGCQRFARSRPDPRFVPMMATWLNNERWSAEYFSDPRAEQQATLQDIERELSNGVHGDSEAHGDRARGQAAQARVPALGRAGPDDAIGGRLRDRDPRGLR